LKIILFSNFDDNFQLMEAEYVEEEEDKDNKPDESSKPSLQQTISFSQNNNENSDNIEEGDEVNEEVSSYYFFILRANLNHYLRIKRPKRLGSAKDKITRSAFIIRKR
jgi:hypothetical protein